jgi:hypothetical protein
MKFIEFGGESRPVKYGWNALATFGDMTGTGLNDLSKFETEMTFKEVLVLIYAGLKEGARAEKKDFALTIEDIGDFLDEDTDKVQEFIDVFTSQMPQSKKVTAPKAGH